MLKCFNILNLYSCYMLTFFFISPNSSPHVRTIYFTRIWIFELQKKNFAIVYYRFWHFVEFKSDWCSYMGPTSHSTCGILKSTSDMLAVSCLLLLVLGLACCLASAVLMSSHEKSL